MFERLRRHFFVGVFTAAPLALTVYLVLFLAGLVDDLFQPIIRQFTRPYFDGTVPGLGIIIGFLIIIFIGMMAPSFIGKHLFTLTERLVERIPLAKVIYSAAKQIFDAFSKGGSDKFRRVVMVEFPVPGSYSIGFVTQEAEEGLVPARPDLKVAVFVPTTPDPTSGFLLFLEPKKLVSINLSVEEGLKLVISAGLVKPQQNETLTAPRHNEI